MLGMGAEADRIETAVAKSLNRGASAPDIRGELTVAQMGNTALTAI